MNYKYSLEAGITRIKTNTRRYVAGALSSFAIAGAVAVPVLAAGPTPGPEAGPGCFGKWRAGSVQVINETGAGPAGKNFFSIRSGDNSTQNADARATCAAS